MVADYQWTDGNNSDFQMFYQKTEEYYSKIVGGLDKRKAFVPYNASTAIDHVIIVYDGKTAIACAGLKHYSEADAEIKRVWVEPEYRGKHIAQDMMKQLEDKARNEGYKRLILQTRELMTDAVGLYEKMGYTRIDNYPPYDTMAGAVCYAKELWT